MVFSTPTDSFNFLNDLSNDGDGDLCEDDLSSFASTTLHDKVNEIEEIFVASNLQRTKSSLAANENSLSKDHSYEDVSSESGAFSDQGESLRSHEASLFNQSLGSAISQLFGRPDPLGIRDRDKASPKCFINPAHVRISGGYSKYKS